MRLTFGGATVLAAAAAAALVVLAACNSGQGVSEPSPAAQPLLSPTPLDSSTPAATSTPGPTPAPAPTVRGMIFPIGGACLPASDRLLPNAPRDYRAGIHEGIDFYDGLACADIVKDTPVLAAQAGTVVRADRDFVEMTPQERDRLLTLSQEQGYTDAETLNRFRGRQVWIDHGGSIITRYGHLSGIAPGIDVGVFVAAGETIGYVGNSGTPDGVTNPNAEIHLHFEIRIGDSYLGQGLTFEEMVAALEEAFSP